MTTNKIKKLEELKKIVFKLKEDGKRIIFSNGCFDFLHVGHIRYLNSAKALGDVLITAINCDYIVKELKGDGRPMICDLERAEIISNIECVDYVIIFFEPTVEKLLLELKPNIHAKGTDYTRDSVPEREIVRSYGGEVEIVGDPKDRSSSGYAKVMKNCL